MPTGDPDSRQRYPEGSLFALAQEKAAEYFRKSSSKPE